MSAQDYKLTSTAADIRELKRSAVYSDFCLIAKARLDAISDEIDAAVAAGQDHKVSILSGERRGVKFWLIFADEMLNVLDTQEEEKNNDSEY